MALWDIFVPPIEIKSDKRTSELVNSIDAYIKMRVEDKKPIDEIEKEIIFYVSVGLNIFKAYTECK